MGETQRQIWTHQTFCDGLLFLAHRFLFPNSTDGRYNHDLLRKEIKIYNGIRTIGYCSIYSWRNIYIFIFSYSLPEIKYKPLASTANDVTASRWATIAWANFPVLLSKNLICLSSCAVIVSGSVGCETTHVIAPNSLELSYKIDLSWWNCLRFLWKDNFC